MLDRDSVDLVAVGRPLVNPRDSADVVGPHVAVVGTHSILAGEIHRSYSEEAVAAVVRPAVVVETGPHPTQENHPL